MPLRRLRQLTTPTGSPPPLSTAIPGPGWASARSINSSMSASGFVVGSAARSAPRVAGVEIRDRQHNRVGLDEVQPRDAGDELGDIRVGRVEDDLLRRADLDDHAVLHDRDAVADADRLIEVVGDENGGLAEVLGQLAELVLQLAADQRVERAERLIHQDDFGIGGQRAGEADALLHAARELAGVALHPVAEADLAERGLGGAIALGLWRLPAPRGRRRRSR